MGFSVGVEAAAWICWTLIWPLLIVYIITFYTTIVTWIWFKVFSLPVVRWVCVEKEGDLVRIPFVDFICFLQFQL